MKYLVNKSNINGKTRIPGSKSGTARGIVLGSLAEGTTVLRNPMPGIVCKAMKGGKTLLPGVNSQWLSPLLIACPFLNEDSYIRITDEPMEKPYINLTTDYLKKAGVTVNNQDFCEYHISGNQMYRSFTADIPSDWCGATYPMVAAAITDSRLVLEWMNMDDRQGERMFVPILKEMGCKVEVIDNGKGGVIIEGGNELHGIEIDCIDMPDAIPALSVLGCCAKGKTVLTNIGACRLKETDRAKSIKEELERMGARIDETQDTLTIYQSELKGVFINGHHDHRIVMATAVAAMVAKGQTMIDHAEYVRVSFPNFYETMKGMGAAIQRLGEI
jgi:3-phosphoshikimate 1-carboxyvinyltransferase